MTSSIVRHRRRLAIAALALAALLTLSACGSKSSAGGANGGEPQTITLSYASSNNVEAAYETLAKDYMAAHPGVTIKPNRIALNAYNQTLTTQMQAGNGPDVMYINSGTGQAATVGQLAKANLLMELTDASLKTDVPATELQGYSYNSKLYGLPSATALSGIVYNDVLAKQNGVTITASSTLDDVIAQCGKVKSSGKSIFGLAGSISQNTGVLAVEIATSTVYGPNPKWNADRAASKTTFSGTAGWTQALQSIVDLNKAGCFQNGAAGAGFDALTNGSSQGKLFGFFAPSGATKDIMDASKGAVKLVALPFPAPKGLTTYGAVTSDIGLAGNAKTKSPKLVADFLKFSVSAAEAKKFSDAQGSIPIGNVTGSELLPQYAPVASLLSGKKYLPFAADDWPNGKVYDALGTGVTGLLTGQKTIPDVLKAMDTAWNG